MQSPCHINGHLNKQVEVGVHPLLSSPHSSFLAKIFMFLLMCLMKHVSRVIIHVAAAHANEFQQNKEK